MNYEIALTPTGLLRIICSEKEPLAEKGADKKTDQSKLSWFEKVADGFVSCTESGLFRLAASKPDLPLPATLLYWRKLSEGYLTELCGRTDPGTESWQPVEAPPIVEREMLVLSAPPMQGGEYLNSDVIKGLWVNLDQWVKGK